LEQIAEQGQDGGSQAVKPVCIACENSGHGVCGGPADLWSQ
jgi:hypothetical protein